MLQTFTFTGVGRQIDAKARFFRYESGSAGGADESIRLRADGNDLGSYLPGDAIRLPIDASRWEIVPSNAATEGTVRLGIGSVESARLAGTVAVIDRINPTVRSDSGATTAVGSTQVTTIVAAGGAPNGILIRSMFTDARAGAGGTAGGHIIAAAALPVGYTGAQMMTLCRSSDVDGTQKITALFDLKKQTPSGWGLYFVAGVSVAVAIANSWFICYEIL